MTILRDLAKGQPVEIRRGPFGGKRGVVVEFRQVPVEFETYPSLFFLTVEVRAFGGRARIDFVNATSDDVATVPSKV